MGWRLTLFTLKPDRHVKTLFRNRKKTNQKLNFVEVDSYKIVTEFLSTICLEVLKVIILFIIEVYCFKCEGV